MKDFNLMRMRYYSYLLLRIDLSNSTKSEEYLLCSIYVNYENISREGTGDIGLLHCFFFQMTFKSLRSVNVSNMEFLTYTDNTMQNVL